MLNNLFKNPGIRIQIIEELIKFAHKELLYKYTEDLMQGYFNYVLFTIESYENIQNNNENITPIPFPTDAFKNLSEFVNTHICLKTLIEIILALLKTQKVSTQFKENPKVFFNEDLVSDIYSVLMSIFKYVLKKPNITYPENTLINPMSTFHEFFILAVFLYMRFYIEIY